MPTVALDIGHGSDTYNRTGGKGVVRNGRVYEEHDANSDTTLRTKAMLEAHGIDVWLPQPAYSKEVWLTERTDEANRRGVDLYWSTHYNAGIPSAHGVCSFYWHTAEKSRHLATAYARNAREAGFETHGDGTHASRPDSWTNLHVCRETSMTAVLTENGFMTSDIDFPGVFGRSKDEYHQRIAEVHAKSICEFFGIAFDRNKLQTKGESDMLKKAIVIGSFADFPIAEPLASRLDVPFYLRHTAEQEQVADEIIVCGGQKEGLKGDKFIDLSGSNRYATAENIKEYLDTH